MTEQGARRRRGRPRGGSDSRQRIIAAAVDEFSEHGYDGSTIRSIAIRAGIDPALVHHYFGTKADLFTKVAEIPLRPDLDVPGIIAGPRDEVGERLVRYVLESFEQRDVRRRGVMLLRAAIGSPLSPPLLAGFLSREIIGRVAAQLDVTDAELRAALVSSQIVGMIVARYLLALKPIEVASVEELGARIGPVVQRYLFG